MPARVVGLGHRGSRLPVAVRLTRGEPGRRRDPRPRLPVEKQRTTPDAYPLSLNALRLACNQATNRDPVVDYDESAIRDGARRLSQRGWARLASGPGSRAVKYRHLLDEALGLDDGETALLTVLMLRGAQTPGELKQRSRAAPPLRLGSQVIETARVAHRARARRGGWTGGRGRRRSGTSTCSARAGPAQRSRRRRLPRRTGSAPSSSGCASWRSASRRSKGA